MDLFFLTEIMLREGGLRTWEIRTHVFAVKVRWDG